VRTALVGCLLCKCSVSSDCRQDLERGVVLQHQEPTCPTRRYASQTPHALAINLASTIKLDQLNYFTTHSCWKHPLPRTHFQGKCFPTCVTILCFKQSSAPFLENLLSILCCFVCQSVYNYKLLKTFHSANEYCKDLWSQDRWCFNKQIRVSSYELVS